MSLRILEMLKPSIEVPTENRFRKAYAKCLALEKTGCSKAALNEFSSLNDELPPKFASELVKVRDKLLARLQGIVEVKFALYKDFVIASAKVDASASDIATGPLLWSSR